MTILILSHETDLHAINMLARCRKRGVDALLFNPQGFPAETLVATFEEAWRSTLTIKGRALDLAEVTGIWYRRPDPPEVHQNLLGQARTFALAESRHALEGSCTVFPLHADVSSRVEHRSLRYF